MHRRVSAASPSCNTATRLTPRVYFPVIRFMIPDMKSGGPHPGIDTLRDLYVTQKLSTRECAKRIGVSGRTISDWLKQAEIPARTIAVAKRGQKPAPHTIEASVRARRKFPIPGKPVVGYKITGDGYIAIYKPDHPDATSQGYVLEHRLVMEQKLGRRLLAHEIPHHRNQVRTDNRPSNLILKTRPDHMRGHYFERKLDPRTGRFLPKSRPN